jgi:hypothetical protein
LRGGICYANGIVRRFSFYLVVGLLAGGWLALSSRADSFKLTTGETVTGELLATTATDQGVKVKVAEGEYQQVSWASFSQDDLKTFARNPKMAPFVEPFIEVSQAEKAKKTEVEIKQPPRLERPARQSLFGALFSSNIGLLALFLLYAANIYAAFEVSVFRAQPAALVCGLAAIPVLGLASTIVFLSLPTKMQPTRAEEVAAAAEAAQAATAAEEDVNPMHADGAAHPSGLQLHQEAETKKPGVPEAVRFQRGQFTFNRRFIETKFPGFFGVVRRDAEKDLVLIFKTMRGEYAGQRISRIAANDLHLQVQKGHATEEVLIPFTEIQEILLKQKEA